MSASPNFMVASKNASSLFSALTCDSDASIKAYMGSRKFYCILEIENRPLHCNIEKDVGSSITPRCIDDLQHYQCNEDYTSVITSENVETLYKRVYSSHRWIFLSGVSASSW